MSPVEYGSSNPTDFQWNERCIHISSFRVPPSGSPRSTLDLKNQLNFAYCDFNAWLLIHNGSTVVEPDETPSPRPCLLLGYGTIVEHTPYAYKQKSRTRANHAHANALLKPIALTSHLIVKSFPTPIEFLIIFFKVDFSVRWKKKKIKINAHWKSKGRNDRNSSQDWNEVVVVPNRPSDLPNGTPTSFCPYRI